MEELKEIKSPYHISKTENGYIISCNDEFCYENNAIIWNEENQCRVITLKRYYDDFSYHVEYVFFTEDFEILGTYRESEGVNPSFILAPTKEIWVAMSATRECYPFGKDVTLPIFKRSRIETPVIKRDTGMKSFFLGGQTFGFITDMWGEGKDSKLVLHQFDKSGLYKNRKGKSLTGIKGGFITTLAGRAYMYSKGLYEINKNLSINFIGDFKEEHEYWSLLLDMDDDDVSFIHIDDSENNIDIVKYTHDGKQIKKETLYNSKNKIYCIHNETLIDGTLMIGFQVCENIITIGYKNGKFCIYERERETHLIGTKMLKYGLMLWGNSTGRDTKLEIVRMTDMKVR